MMTLPPLHGRRSAAEQALRRLDFALQSVIVDRSPERPPLLATYVDFSELYAYAFGHEPELPDYFLGGGGAHEAETAAMLEVATHHTFNGWSKPLGMLPPHRSELARRLRHHDENIASFERLSRQLSDLLPESVKSALAHAQSGIPALINAIVRGGLNALCNDLLSRDRELSVSNRAVPVLRKLIDTGALVLTDMEQVRNFEPTAREVSVVEAALQTVRPSASNFIDARALVYLRQVCHLYDGRVAFVTRSRAMRKALGELARGPQGAEWRVVQRCVRVPEAILLDFLAGADDRWLTTLRARLEHFLAQLERSRMPHTPQHEHEVVDIVSRAWADLTKLLNLRRATRSDVSELLARHGHERDPVSRLAEILSTPSFVDATRRETSRLLYEIERKEWVFALNGADVYAPQQRVVVSVHSNSPSAHAIVQFTTGAISTSLEFAGPINTWLNLIPRGNLDPSSIRDGLLAQEIEPGPEGSLLVAAFLGAAERWRDAIPYCDRALEGDGSSAEALYWRAICLRKSAVRACESGMRVQACEDLRQARGDIERAMRERKDDPRHRKELATIILAWLDCGLSPEPNWEHATAVKLLEDALGMVDDEHQALAIEVMNNLCYAYAIGDQDAWVETGIALSQRLEARLPAERDSRICDTILLLQARHAYLQKDSFALSSLSQKFETLIHQRDHNGEPAHVPRQHLDQVRAWRDSLPLS